MNVSRLKVRIKIQENIARVDNVGNHINKWKDYYTCWASASASQRDIKETEESALTLEQDQIIFIVRYCDKTSVLSSTGYRIIMKDKIYDIQHVDFMTFDKKSIKISAKLERR